MNERSKLKLKKNFFKNICLNSIRIYWPISGWSKCWSSMNFAVRFHRLNFSCFDRLFKSVNADLHKFHQKRNTLRLINNENLVGIEYLWQVILNGIDSVFHRAVYLIKETYTNIDGSCKQETKNMHQAFLTDYYDRLVEIYQNRSPETINQLIRILIVLREYILECDHNFKKERVRLPSFR